MKRSAQKTNRLELSGDSMMDHLSSQARRKRKRQASKKRRARLKAEDSRYSDQI